MSVKMNDGKRVTNYSYVIVVIVFAAKPTYMWTTHISIRLTLSYAYSLKINIYLAPSSLSFVDRIVILKCFIYLWTPLKYILIFPHTMINTLLCRTPYLPFNNNTTNTHNLFCLGVLCILRHSNLLVMQIRGIQIKIYKYL